jgi:hypothetical protein
MSDGLVESIRLDRRLIGRFRCPCTSREAKLLALSLHLCMCYHLGLPLCKLQLPLVYLPKVYIDCKIMTKKGAETRRRQSVDEPSLLADIILSTKLLLHTGR